MVTWRGHAGAISGLAFDPAGRRLASTGKGTAALGELKLWDAADGKVLAAQTWSGLLAAVDFSPDGPFLVTAGHDGQVIAWDENTLRTSVLLRGRMRGEP